MMVKLNDCFFAKIISVSGDKFTCKCMRPYIGRKEQYIFPSRDDIFSVQVDNIIKKAVVVIKCFRDVYTFQL